MTHKEKQKNKSPETRKSIIHPVQWLSAAVVIVYLFGALFPSHITWGINIWSVFPAPIAFAVLLLTGLLMLIPTDSRFHLIFERMKQSAYEFLLSNNRYFNLIFLSVALFFLFYIFRSRAFVYGDGYLMLSNLTNPDLSFDFRYFFMKPLAVLFHRSAYSVLANFISSTPSDILAITIASGGVLGFWAINRIARIIAGKDNSHWVILAGISCTASVILFFGYMENYTWVTALSLWSLAFSMGYLKNQNSPWPGIVMGILATGFHVLAVSFLIMAIMAIFLKNDEQYKLFKTFSPAKIYMFIIVLSFMAALIFQLVNLPEYIVKIWPVENNRYWFLSAAHLIDILNQILLVAPLGITVLLFTLSKKSQNEKVPDPLEYLLVLTALFTFLVTFWVNPELGAPRDWDLLSLCGFPLTIWGMYRLNRRYPRELIRLRYLFPFGLLSLVLLVPNLYEKNNLSAAAARLDKMLWEDAHYQKDYKNAERCIYWSYILEHNVGDFNRAARYFERHFATEKGGFAARLDWGKMYLERGMNDSAYFWLNSAAEINPENFELLYNLSIVEQARGNIQTAVTYAEKALRLSPDKAEIHTQLAILNQAGGQSQKALRHFQNAFQLKPSSYTVALNLGREFQTLKIYDSAVFYMNKSLALSQGVLKVDNNFLTRLGYLELGLGQYDSALVHTRLAMEVFQYDVTVQRQLGIILTEMNRNREALAHFREAYRLSPGTVQEIINLGLSFSKSENYDSAYYYLMTGVNQGGTSVKNTTIYKSLFNSCLALRKTNKAREILTELESFAPDYRKLDEMRRRLNEAVR